MSIHQDLLQSQFYNPRCLSRTLHLESKGRLISHRRLHLRPRSALSSSRARFLWTKGNWIILLASFSTFIAVFLVSRQAFLICFLLCHYCSYFFFLSLRTPPLWPVPHWSVSRIRGALLQARFPLFRLFLQPQPSSASTLRRSSVNATTQIITMGGFYMQYLESKLVHESIQPLLRSQFPPSHRQLIHHSLGETEFPRLR